MVFAIVLLLFLGVTCGQSRQISQEDCVIPFDSQRYWDTFWPLVYNDQGKLLDTSFADGIVSTVVPSGESIIASCGPNYIKKDSPKEFIEAKCQPDGKFNVDDNPQLKSAKDLACDLRSIQEVLTDVKGCPKEMKAVKFGLVNPVDQQAYITGEACYNEIEGRTLFAHVRKGDLVSSALEILKKDVLKGRAPESRYKMDFMKAFRLDEFNERLETTLKTKKIPAFTMTRFVDDPFLFNRQLYSTKKLSWNYLFVHEDLSNYELLKQDIGDLKGNVDIYTGSHGVGSFNNREGVRVPIYLDYDRFPLAKFVWIVVRVDGQDTAFTLFNDPTLTDAEVKENSFCLSKCEGVSWLNRLKKDEKFASAKDGYVLCCDLTDFKAAIPEYPSV